MGPLMIQREEIFVGREQELKRMFDALAQGKHLLILGEKGCGKTALAKEFIRQAQAGHKGKILLSNRSHSLKDTCLELAGSLYSQGMLTKVPKGIKELDPGIPWEKAERYFSTLKTSVLKNMIFNNIREPGELIIVLDHLGKMKLKFFMFLDSLRDHARLILIARSAQKKETGRLWMMLWGFEKIELKPLTHDETTRLARHWLGEVSKGPVENNKWFREAVRISRGNPEALRGLCDEIRRQKLTAKGEVHVRLANIDRKITSLLQEE